MKEYCVHSSANTHFLLFFNTMWDSSTLWHRAIVYFSLLYNSLYGYYKICPFYCWWTFELIPFFNCDREYLCTCLLERYLEVKMSSLRGYASPNIYMLIPHIFSPAVELIYAFASVPIGLYHLYYLYHLVLSNTDVPNWWHFLIYIYPVRIGHLDFFFYDVSVQGFCQVLNWMVCFLSFS